MMKRTIIFALLAFGMLRSASAQITQPATLGDMPRAQFGQTYNNAFLNHTQARSNNISVKPVAQQPIATMQGTVFSNDLFARKSAKSNSAFVHQGFAEMSAYQHISPSDIGASGTTSAPRKGFGPPPPTPDPDNPHILPIGDACWWLLLLAVGYAALTIYRRRKNA